MVTMPSETEHHSHRTDEEWRAMLRGWLSHLDEAGLSEFPITSLMAAWDRIAAEMEKESK